MFTTAIACYNFIDVRRIVMRENRRKTILPKEITYFHVVTVLSKLYDDRITCVIIIRRRSRKLDNYPRLLGTVLNFYGRE